MSNTEPFCVSKTVINALTDIDLLSLDLHYSAEADEAYENLKRKIKVLHEKIQRLCLYSEYIGNACIILETEKPLDTTTDHQPLAPAKEISLS